MILGTVFDDANGNGEQDAGEPGIPGVRVNLRNGISGTITTDPNGDYSFSLSWSGHYTVTATTPAGYTSTTPEEIVALLTGPGQQVQVDFGYRGVGTIRGTVFDDRNINGTHDEGEPGISGVTITLLQGGSTISTTATGGDGSYVFDSVLLGDYTVEETNLPDYTSTTLNVRSVSLTTPGQEETVNFGDYGPSRITGIVFNDIDGDGAKDTDEKGIPGVPVDLSFEGTLEMTKTTDSNGVYFFLWEDLGTYTVTQTNLTGYVSISDDEVEVVKDEANQVEVVNFADRGVGTIHGIVFDDENRNQELDAGEPGIDDVTVTLLQDDTVVRTVTTASDGYYEFIALGLGDYAVRETDPEGYDSITPNEVTTTLTISRHAAWVNFGDRGVGTIRGVVFDDRDGSREQDVGEPGIEGVNIAVLQEGSTVFTATTTSMGVYVFDPVWLGEYVVRETDPEGYVSTTPNTATVSLTMTKQVEVRSFGDRGVGTIEGTVFSDENGNGEQDGEEQGLDGVNVTLLQDGSQVSTTTTAGDGTYAFTSVFLGDYTVRETDPEGYNSTTPNDVDVSIAAAGQRTTADFGDQGVGAIRGAVFHDENGNGAQDPGETGIEGVTLTLLSAGSPLSTTTTAGDGTYAFDPVWLGDYQVRETDPNGYISVTPNQVTVSLTTPGQVEEVDFGDQGVGTIQGTVFDDRNGDGTQDGGEPGIGGVTITLVHQGSAIDSTTTAGDGTYAFASVTLGSYTVQETDPEGYDSTTDNSVEVSLLVPGQTRFVDFGDQGPTTIHLPIVARHSP
jgi:hypothetical protein